jgi:allantoin racemase
MNLFYNPGKIMPRFLFIRFDTTPLNLTKKLERKVYNMKIWHQSMTDLSRLPAYRRNMTEHAAKVLGPEHQVVIKGMPAGVYEQAAPVKALKYPYLEFLNARYICEAAMTAEREGFHVMSIGCYLDTGLKLARSLVDIPVAGITETSMLISCSLGKGFSVVTIDPFMVDRFITLAKEYGLKERVSSIISLDPPIQEFDMEGDGHHAEELFLDSCRKAVAAGADVIIPGEGVLNEFAFSRGITSWDGVPILDGNAAVWHYAILMAGLKQKTGLGVGRKLSYPKPSREAMDSLRAFHQIGAMNINDFS